MDRRQFMKTTMAGVGVALGTPALASNEPKLEDLIYIEGVYTKPELFDNDRAPEDQFSYLGRTTEGLDSGTYVAKTSRGFVDISVQDGGAYRFSNPECLRRVYNL